MRKKIFSIAAVLTVLAVSAVGRVQAKAVKSSRGVETPAPVAQAPGYQWEGLYASLRSGILFGNTDYQTIFTYDPTSQVSGSNQPFGGAIGEGLDLYLQSGAFVFGLHSDMNLTSASGSKDFIYPYTTGVETFTSRVDWFGSTQVRLGLAQERFLFTAGAGLGYGGVDYQDSDTELYTDLRSTVATGLALGLGLGYAVSDRMVLGISYEFIPFDQTYQMVYFNDPLNNYSLHKTTVHSLAVETSFKF